ncbi:MAG: hypothetical protein LBT04_02035 [Prevotellaceae bacterium]|jgi:hypothetical protein|nr:hypothetical protein [Prevotellaceae bacterium]
MSKERECGISIRQIVGERRYDTYLAIVKAVDDATCTVDRLIDEKEFENVRLNVSGTENEGIVITPKIYSTVLITTIDGYEWFVSQYSEIEKITIDSQTDIVINGGENHGLVKVDKMVEWMQKVYNDLNTLKAQLSTFAVTGNGAPLGMVFNPTVPSPQINNFENEKITH